MKELDCISRCGQLAHGSAGRERNCCVRRVVREPVVCEMKTEGPTQKVTTAKGEEEE